MNATEVASLRLQLVDTGWNPIPVRPSTKKPAISEWSTVEANEHHIENWARTVPNAISTGLCCNRNYFAVDIDVVSSNDLARSLMAVAFDKLGYTPFVRVGRAPKLLLVYRQKPGSITSTKRYAACGNGDLVEILGNGKQFIAFGIHPDTHQPYTWIGEASPLESGPSEAPLVDQGDVDAFLNAVHEVMPLGTPDRRGKTGKSGDDQPLVYNGQGLVTDGRERLMRGCVFEAAHDIWNANEPLETRALADRAWMLFIGRAWLEDEQWSLGDAIEHARWTIRRINNGTISLNAPINDLEQFFTLAADTDVASTRDAYAEKCQRFRYKIAGEPTC
jgi:hypothetical protein